MSASPSYESLAWADMAFAAQLPGVRRLTVTQPLAQISQQATQLLQQAQAIGYNGQNIGQQFQQLYP